MSVDGLARARGAAIVGNQVVAAASHGAPGGPGPDAKEAVGKGRSRHSGEHRWRGAPRRRYRTSLRA
jgi:hypothetical protein